MYSSSDLEQMNEDLRIILYHIVSERSSMKRKNNVQQRQKTRVPADTQLAALRQSTAARKQATVDRLQRAIEVLKRQRREISVQTVYEECGLRYAAIYRNPEALALFRANSRHKQLAVSVDVAVKREARIVELQAKLAELEPYRTFVEHIHAQMRREEQGRFGDLP